MSSSFKVPLRSLITRVVLVKHLKRYVPYPHLMDIDDDMLVTIMGFSREGLNSRSPKCCCIILMASGAVITLGPMHPDEWKRMICVLSLNPEAH